MDVALIQWPSERRKRKTLAQRGKPRLLLVDTSASAPIHIDVFEDWIRLPATEEDVDARVRSLKRRAREHHQAEPTVDGTCTLRYGRFSISLAPLHAQLAAPLIDNFGDVVSRSRLLRAGWQGRPPDQHSLDVQMARLTELVGPIGLTIRPVAMQGYVMETPPLAD
jgi:DNA-binding response OmpR family regulator